MSEAFLLNTFETGADTSVQYETAEHNSQVAVIKRHSKRWVAGLTWMPLTRPNSAAKEARQIAQRESLRLASIRRGGRWLQAAFVPSQTTGLDRSMVSLAAVLIEQLGPSWIAVYPIDEQRQGLIAVDEGSIIPGCDFVGTSDEVAEKFQYVYALFPNWAHVYAPAVLSPDALALDLEGLLSRARPKANHRLNALRSGRFRLGVAAFTAAALAGSGFIYWQQQRDAAELERLQQAFGSQPAVEAPKVVQPWDNKPAARAYLARCVEALQRLPVVGAAWKLDRASCQNGNLEVVYNRSAGATLLGFQQWASQRYQKAITLLEGAEQASFQLPVAVQDLPKHRSPMQASPLFDLYSHFQGFNLTVLINRSASALATPGAAAGDAEPRWQSMPFEFESDLAPDKLLSNFDSSGISIAQVELDLKQPIPTWKVKGEVYERS